MGKAVMLSIHPKYCELIANGEKAVEVRKTRPKIETPFKCYIYCTKGNVHTVLLNDGNMLSTAYCINYKTAIITGAEICNGKVIGEFVCDRINHLNGYWLQGEDGLKETTCLDDAKIMDYIEYVEKTFYLWRISDLKIYDKPKELSEFNGFCKLKKECYADTVRQCNDTSFDCKCKPLTRAPQSWCYVEELEK